MRRVWILLPLLALTCLALVPGGSAQPAKKVGPDPKEWDRVVDGAIAYLRSTQGEDGLCSHAHQSLFQVPPSTWWAAVAVPHVNPSGNA